MTLQVIEVPDTDGKLYDAYVGYTEKGHPVYICKGIADIEGKEQMMAEEIRYYEKQGK
jgi:hypothetical protein